MAKSILSFAWANDQLWQRNDYHVFSPRSLPPPLTLITSCLFSVSNGWHCPSLITVSTNNYESICTQDPNQNIILTHDLFLPVVPPLCRGQWSVLEPALLSPKRLIKAISWGFTIVAVKWKKQHNLWCSSSAHVNNFFLLGN